MNRYNLILSLVFSILPLLIFSQQDTAIYDINDPRNPNCPCHLYQKMADEEYKKELERNKGSNSANNSAGNSANSATSANSAGSDGSGSSGNSAGRTRKKSHFNLKKITGRVFKNQGGKGILRNGKRLNDCFHF